MASRIGKYFGSSGSSSGSPTPPGPQDFNHYKQKAEEWVRKNPMAAVAIAALGGAMLLGSPALRKLAIPMILIGLRRWIR